MSTYFSLYLPGQDPAGGSGVLGPDGKSYINYRGPIIRRHFGSGSDILQRTKSRKASSDWARKALSYLNYNGADRGYEYHWTPNGLVITSFTKDSLNSVTGGKLLVGLG